MYAVGCLIEGFELCRLQSRGCYWKKCVRFSVQEGGWSQIGVDSTTCESILWADRCLICCAVPFCLHVMCVVCTEVNE